MVTPLVCDKALHATHKMIIHMIYRQITQSASRRRWNHVIVTRYSLLLRHLTQPTTAEYKIVIITFPLIDVSLHLLTLHSRKSLTDFDEVSIQHTWSICKTSIISIAPQVNKNTWTALCRNQTSVYIGTSRWKVNIKFCAYYSTTV